VALEHAGEQAFAFVLTDAEERLLKRLEVCGSERLVVAEALDGNLVLMAAEVVLDLLGVLAAGHLGHGDGLVLTHTDD
jgi:hypothetical protein